MDIAEIIKPGTIYPSQYPVKEKDQPPPPLEEKELEYYRDYVMIESKLVNDTLILCFDKKNFKRVRKRHPGIPIYFEPEINELWKYREDKETIKWLHAVKKQFQGWVMPSGNKQPYVNKNK
ncbi:MAG: hypothetical protein ACE5GL_03360 [Calditrichia bacterium]